MWVIRQGEADVCTEGRELGIRVAASVRLCLLHQARTNHCQRCEAVPLGVLVQFGLVEFQVVGEDVSPREGAGDGFPCLSEKRSILDRLRWARGQMGRLV